MIRRYAHRVLALAGFLVMLPLALAWIVAALLRRNGE
jgi:heme A synthase